MKPGWYNAIPEWLLAAIVFLLPWQTRYILTPGMLNGVFWEYGTVSVYAIDFVVALFILATVALHAAHQKRFRLNLSHATALFLLLIAALGTSFAGNKISALFWLVKLAEGIAFFICITQTKLRFPRVAWPLITAGVIQSTLAIYQFTVQHVTASSWLGMAAQKPSTLGVQVVENSAGRTLRAYGSLPHPNMLGGFLVISLLICIIYFCKTRSVKKRLTLVACIALQSVALMTTFSRQAWIALGVALTVAVIYTFVHEKTFPAMMVFAIATATIPMLLFAYHFSTLINTRVSTDTRLEQKSVDDRETYIQQSIDMLQDHWFTGVGIGNDTAFIQSQDRSNNIYKAGDEYQPVHNIYLLAFVELGIFGLAAFIFFLLSLFFQKPWTNAAVMVWGLCVVALCTIGVFDHYLWSLHFGILLFWLTASLLVQAATPVDSRA